MNATFNPEALQQRALDAIEANQQRTLERAEALVGKVRPLVAKVPSPPFPNRLPKVDDTFAGKVLMSQRDFGKQLVTVVTSAGTPAAL